MNLSNILNIGRNGLNAAAHGQNVTGQNISNASTPGYSRRITDIEAIPLKDGGGARANGSTRVHDQYLERRGLGASAGDGEAKARVETLQVLDSVFSEDAGNLGGALDAFDGALSDFAANPNSRANRDAVLTKAGELSRAFNTTSDQLTAARGDANGKITDAVRTVNSKLNDIASLGSKIVLARATGNEAGDLEDRRDQLIRDVASEIPINVIEDDSGAVTLQLASSRTLVGPDGRVNPLVAQMDPGLGDVRIFRETSGQLEDITNLVTTGTIGGAISARDGALATARTQLDQLASDVSTAYNTVHSAGYGLDGNTARNLFSVPTGVPGAARNMSVSADVAGQPDFIAGATETANLPSDNRNAIALLGLRDSAVGAGSSNTAQQAFRAIVADAGTAGQSAATQATQAGAVKGQIDALREASSGVSTDEEMISLMKFQRAYTASLRVIETADSMMQELLNIRR